MLGSSFVWALAALFNALFVVGYLLLQLLVSSHTVQHEANRWCLRLIGAVPGFCLPLCPAQRGQECPRRF